MTPLELAEEIINGRRITRQDDLTFFLDCNLDELCEGADRIRKHFVGDKVDLCSIINGRSGKCPEDCKYCAQSAHNHTDCEVYDFLPEEDIAGEYGLSGATMERLLRVNYLTCDMKTAVDNGKLPLLSAVNLSYIDDNAQCDVYSVMKESGVKVNENMSRKIRTLFESGDFDLTACRNIMIHPEKIVTNQKVSVSSSTFSKYFAGKKKKEIEDIIEKALAAYLG